MQQQTQNETMASIEKEFVDQIIDKIPPHQKPHNFSYQAKRKNDNFNDEVFDHSDIPLLT